MLSGKIMRRLALAASLAWVPPGAWANPAPAPTGSPPAMPKPASTSTADHGKFKERCSRSSSPARRSPRPA
jgi:hypothetical protein